MSRKQLPEKGMSAQEVLEELERRKSMDSPWQDGRVFAYIYRPEAELEELTRKVYSMYLTENPLDPTIFPSLRSMETEIVDFALDLMHAPEGARGSFSQGGTESILLAAKAAREKYRLEGRTGKPQMLLAETAHPSFHKAAQWLDFEVVMLPVDEAVCAAEPASFAASINADTALVVVSAPSFPQGIVDPVEEIASMAKSHDVPVHVDCCVGGFYLPFLSEGLIPPFDFRVEGVTSMSMDFHKNGYSPKGASVVLFRNPEFQRWSAFASAAWTGYPVANKTVLSSRSGGSTAAAWAALQYQGRAGMRERVAAIQEASAEFLRGMAGIPELRILGDPLINLFSVVSRDEDIDIFELSDEIRIRGFHTQMQFSTPTVPAAIHVSINRDNIPQTSNLVTAFRDAVSALKSRKEDHGEGSNFSAQSDSLDVQKELPERRADLLRMLDGQSLATRNEMLLDFLLR